MNIFSNSNTSYNINKIFSVVVFFIYITTSCNTRSDSVVDCVDLKSQASVIDTMTNEMYPTFMVGTIVISNEFFGENNYYASIIGNNKNRKPELLFKKGHGHNEFTLLKFGMSDDNSLLLLDGTLTAKPVSLTVISKTDSIDNIKEQDNWKRYDLKNLPPFRLAAKSFCSLSDSTILIPGATYDHFGSIFSVIDFKNSKAFPLEFWPDDGIEIEEAVKHAVYTDNSSVFGNGNGRYCYQCGEERFVFIFSIDNNKINVLKNLYSVYPDYKTEDGQNYNMKSRRPETLSCAVNNNYIYILLKEFDKEGNKRDEWQPDLYGNIVEVYDWDGNKQKEIRLDHYGQRIMLSDDNNMHLFTDDYYDDNFKSDIWIYCLKGIVN